MKALTFNSLTKFSVSGILFLVDVWNMYKEKSGHSLTDITKAPEKLQFLFTPISLHCHIHSAVVRHHEASGMNLQ